MKTPVTLSKSVQIKGYSNWIEGYIHDVQGGVLWKSIIETKCNAQLARDSATMPSVYCKP